MEDYGALIGATLCCLVPFLLMTVSFYLGVRYGREGGLPIEVRLRRRDDIDV
jgi:hypothetical protein